MLYFDCAATAVRERRFLEEATDVSLHYFANASSHHQWGRDAKSCLEEYRCKIAQLLHLEQASDLIFTSGATEANHMVLSSLLRSPARGVILMSKAEHPSVYENQLWLKQLGFTIKEVDVDDLGRLSLESLKKLLTKEVRMLCCMAINYQSGAINDISLISSVLRAYTQDNGGRPIHLHVDGAQVILPRLYQEFVSWDCDSFSLSAHKLGGPNGSGLLYWRRAKQGFLLGGGQEQGMRSGTENLFGVVGLFLAMQRLVDEPDTQLQEKVKLLERAVELAGGYLYNKEASMNIKSPYHHLVRFDPIPGEIIQRQLSQFGIMVGTNSACSASHNDGSRLRALLAQGISMQEAKQMVRFSFSPWTHISQLEQLVKELPKAMQSLPR